MHERNRVTAAAVLAVPTMPVEKHEMDSAHSIDCFAQSKEVFHARVRSTDALRIERFDLDVAFSRRAAVA